MPSSTRRPSSAPGDKPAVASSSRAEGDPPDDNKRSAVPRPSKPPLLRSKSEHGLPYNEADDDVDEEVFDMGARHGFDDHYLSEDVIAQLANVSGLPITGLPTDGRSRAASAPWLRRDRVSGRGPDRSGCFMLCRGHGPVPGVVSQQPGAHIKD